MRNLAVIIGLLVSTPYVHAANIPDVLAQAPAPQQPAAPPTAPPPTAVAARDVADLYVRVGRELLDVSRVDPKRTFDLWPRYRWIRILDVMRDPTKRAGTVAFLERLRMELHEPATKSAKPAPGKPAPQP